MVSMPDRRWVEIEAIHMTERMRPVNEKKAAELADSIREVGLLSPPAVRISNGIEIDGEICDYVPVLIFGRHRVRAFEILGRSSIECEVKDVGDIEAELIEISENLHRSELTALERDEQIARWIELTTAKPAADDVPRQPDAKPRGGRPEGGTRAAARELGLSEADARRATKVASLCEEAKATAREAGLDDNRTALLAAAKEAEPEQQVAKIKEWNAARELAAAKAAVAKKQEKAAHAVSEEIAIADFYFAWSSIPQHRREEVLAEIGACLVASHGAA
ncbi:ParB/RepB/Spo0J family partition protein [Xanthobacteraceae bacterium A53D]